MNATKLIPNLAPTLLSAFFALGVQAEEIPLTVTHRVIGSQPLDDGRATLTFELTASNDGPDQLSGVSFRLMPGNPLLIEDEESIALDAVSTDQTVKVEWNVTALGMAEDTSLLFQQLRFGAEANDSTGALMTFPVESTEEQP